MTKNEAKRMVKIINDAKEAIEARDLRRVVARINEVEDHPERFRFETTVTRR